MASKKEMENPSVGEETEESGSESEYTDDDEEEEEEEEVEPKLKYERIRNDLIKILERDAASCIAVHSKFLALGTHWGMIHILDHQGNNIRGKELPAHSTTVNAISIDDCGDFLASASDDGKVVINGLYSSDQNQVVELEGPVKAVSLEPDFYKAGSRKRFVAGVDKLTLCERGFLGRRKSEVIHSGEGPIRSLQWRSHFIAWANDLGVKVYDTSSHRRITFIAKDHDKKLRSELYRCCLCWKDDRTLLIGWADQVKVCVVKDRSALETSTDLPNRYVEIAAMYRADYFVCGLAPLLGDIALLTYEMTEDRKEAERGRPHLRIALPGIDQNTEHSNDALSVKDYHTYMCKDYSLAHVSEEQLLYIVSPKDIVVAKPRDDDDHLAWMIQRNKFEEAMAEFSKPNTVLRRHTLQDVGQKYLQYLVAHKRFDDAGRLSQKILGNNRELWEDQVYYFENLNQLEAIAPYLPIADPQLSPTIYELVLNSFLRSKPKVFQQKLREWPSHLYNIDTLVHAVLDKLDKERGNIVLMQSLGDLYSFARRYEKALDIYLKIRTKDVFELIHRHNLFGAVGDKIELLMNFDEDRAVKLFLDHREEIPVDTVVRQLDKPRSRRLLHAYLDELFKQDPHGGQEHHGLQVELCAEFAPAKLLSFLRSSSHYPLQRALEVVRKRDLVPQTVYLLGRMGSMKQALELITQKLKNVEQAIDFCKEHNDQELWNYLIDFSMDKPGFVLGLLNNIGTHVDPILLISRIPPGMEIPGLRDALVKILVDYNLQVSLREGCKKIMVSDVIELMGKLTKVAKKGVSVDTLQSCTLCHERLAVADLRYCSSVAVFFCNHVFHEDCLISYTPDLCPICSSQRRGPGQTQAALR